MSFLHRSPRELLSTEVIAGRSEVEQRLIGQMLHGPQEPTVRELKAGDNLFKQGFFAQAVHLILVGEVAVSVDDAEVARLGPGSVFGEMAMLGPRRRTGTLTALVPTTVCSVGESAVDRDDLRMLAAERGLSTSPD